MYDELTWNIAGDSDGQSISNFFSKVNNFKKIYIELRG